MGKNILKYIADSETNRYDTTDIKITLDGGATISEMLELFECFLKARGFQFDGHLDIVPDDTEMPNGTTPSDNNAFKTYIVRDMWMREDVNLMGLLNEVATSVSSEWHFKHGDRVSLLLEIENDEKE